MITELTALYNALVATPNRRLRTTVNGKRVYLSKGIASTERLWVLVLDGNEVSGIESYFLLQDAAEYADDIEELNGLAVAKFNIDLQSIPLNHWQEG